jgi:hypothetical protein
MFLSYHGFKFSQKILVAAKLFHICKNLIETVDCSYESCVSFEMYTFMRMRGECQQLHQVSHMTVSRWLKGNDATDEVRLMFRE